jgi:amino acid transporter
MAQTAHSPDTAERLPQTMTWRDGFAFALTMPASLVASLGYSIGAIGAWWAMGLWVATTVVAILLTRIYSEMAAMFPQKSGGIAMYAEEAWKRYASFVGPLATWGYWLAWTSSIAVFAGLIALLLQTEFAMGATWTINIGITTLTFQKLVAVGLIAAVFVVNLLGARPTLAFVYVTGAALMLVLFALTVLPLTTGDAPHASRLSGHLGHATRLGGVGVVLVWMYVMFWTVGGLEVSASFTPEYRQGWRDTARALRSSGIFTLCVYILTPLMVVSTLGEKLVAGQPTTFAIPAFNAVLGGASWIPTLLLVGSLLLIIVSCDADGSRTLFGMAKDRMTLRQFGHLNRFKAPARALALSMVLNACLILFVTNTLAIIAASNLGYVLAHVFASSGFVLLRRDRPAMLRPLRLGNAWVPAAIALAVLLVAMLIVGATSFSVTGYGGVKELLIGIGLLSLSLVFFAYRRLVQDRRRLTLGDVTTPELTDAQPELTASALH